MEDINVLLVSNLPGVSLERLAAISPRIRILDGRHPFEQEMRDSWPQATVDRYLPPLASGEAAGEARPSESARRRGDELLAEADVACIGFPYPLDLRSRAPRLKWVHQLAAGASNLRFGDLWGSPVVATTSRGEHVTVPIAEYVIAAAFIFARELPRLLADKQRRRLRRQDYKPLLLRDKTMGIVGLGGIGREVARLARGLGMRVVATRRSATVRLDGSDSVDTVFPPGELVGMLEQCDFVAVCAQHTPETEGLIGAAQLRAMKPTAYLVNVARGELIDEDALVKALREGWIAGAALDVHVGEFERPPRDEFWELPNVILTPHNSGTTDVFVSGAAELFCENLRRFVAGKELLNVIDWERGY